MSRKNSNKDSFAEEATDQWQRIGHRFYTDIPSFGRIWNAVVEACGPSADYHPVARLVKYLKSFAETGQQALYSMERLQLFSTKEASNVFEFYVAHYLYDFLTRIKTATDLLALMINYIFDLGIHEKECSLEKGALSSALRNKVPCTQEMKKLGWRLDEARNDWLLAFYELRNLIIHRAGLRFIAMGVSDAGQSRIHVATGGLLRIADERKLLEKLLSQVGAGSVSAYGTIEPLRLCEELWVELAGLAKDVINECQHQIMVFISLRTL